MSRHHEHWKIIGKKEHRIYKNAVWGAFFFASIQLLAWALWMIITFVGVKGGTAFAVVLASIVMILAAVFFLVGVNEILRDTDRTE
jgi:hypothetical protein